MGAEFTRLVPSDAGVVLVCDASLRFHYPNLVAAVTRAKNGKAVLTFWIPSKYLYGYSAVDDREPVASIA